MKILLPKENITPEKLFKQTLDRLNTRYGREVFAGAIKWAEANRPELVGAMDAAQDCIDNAQDMAGCRQAAANFEQAVMQIINEYSGQQELSVNEAIAIFRPERVWQLQEEKAAVLDRAFSTADDIEAGGHLWRNPRKGRENGKQNAV